MLMQNFRTNKDCKSKGNHRGYTNPLLIINADDFGKDSSINKAIVRAFQENLVSSTTLLTNMPGFIEACSLARKFRLKGCVGVHLNLIEGSPVTEPIKKCERLCDISGSFSGALRNKIFMLSRAEFNAIREELNAQISVCVSAGIIPTHIDSHLNFHISPSLLPLLPIIVRLAHKWRIQAIRLNMNCCGQIGFYKKLYKLFYNFLLILTGLARSDYYGEAKDIINAIGFIKGIAEIGVHPSFSNNGDLIDAEDGRTLKEILLPVFEYDMISYASAKKVIKPKLLILS